MAHEQAFNNMEPKPRQTDPLGLGNNRDYPRHLHKCSEDGKLNLWISVKDAADQAAHEALGWTVERQTAPKGKKAKD